MTELRVLRAARGISYRELAARITRAREERGIGPAAARVAHTTVSDVFRPGRSRLNADLVAEIVRALGSDDATVEEWRARVALRAATGPAPRPSAPVDPSHAPIPATLVDPGPGPLGGPRSRRTTVATAAVLVAAGLLLNATGKFFNPLLGDVFFVDMVGTAAVALLGGPWLAALVGAGFVVVELLKSQVDGALFAATMVFAGLIWGYGVRAGWGRTMPRFLGLSALVAVATSAVAVPITVVYLEGRSGRGLDVLFSQVGETGVGPWLAVATVNLTVSLLDKVFTGAIAYLIAGLVWSLPAAADRFADPRVDPPRRRATR
ncbi:helix-turn-helix domain-containing protein [Microbacterium telephonicum]|uniref:helix-turn-helix domain-containing protein n=1 Tax=Microbacterium telephonicum TaxID=1714841 RepID=UPI0011C3F639|nr:helix-turn-helix transcriptional regulator [Microbacterium telephonicum]